MDASAATGLTAAKSPKLGVIVVFDQLRSEDIDRLDDLWGDNGFGGLRGRGAARHDAHYPYAATETGPGHATLLTGAAPAVHGIVSNSWHAGADQIYAVDDDASVLGFDESDGIAPRGKGPRNLAVGTLGDALKITTGGRARVVTISIKDRAAILTGGFAADLALWYESKLGRFTSSRQYVDRLPDWADELGRSLPRICMAEGRWSPLPIDETLADRFHVDDDHPNETAWAGLKATFPHDICELSADVQNVTFSAMPQAITSLFELGRAAVRHHELGRDEVTDLLVISVSTTDVIGHLYGPMSAEGQDILRRAHDELTRFLADLDEMVGADRYVVAVASDHGGTPLVERVAEHGIAARRLLREDVEQALQAALQGELGSAADASGWVASVHPPHIFLREEFHALPAEVQQRALRRAVQALDGVDGIARSWAPALGVPVPYDPWWPAYELVVFPGRSGDLLIRQQPRHTFRYSTAEAGTDHGTPYVYDRRIPVWFAGQGVRGGRFAQPIDPRDVSATLAFLLRIPPPDACQGHPTGAVGEESRR